MTPTKKNAWEISGSQGGVWVTADSGVREALTA